MLPPVALHIIQILQNPMFQQDSAQPHVTTIVRNFLDMELFRLFPFPGRLPDLSPIENVWSMVTERLTRHHTPVITGDELWHRVEAVHEHLYLYMPSNLCFIQCPVV
ncbi:transposable element Tcb1 transposase [Trichonephila clavipes]|nr:transposable element Tcb1 transposase [Trichonephila clavipes]